MPQVVQRTRVFPPSSPRPVVRFRFRRKLVPPHDVLGAVFETLARRAEKDTRVGQFFTPQPVVDFCAGVVPLSPRDVVLDPAVGTGRFLIRAMEVMLKRASDGGEPRRKTEQAIRSERLLGADIGGWVATIAKMNMFIQEQLVKAETALLDSDLEIRHLESALPDQEAARRLPQARRTRDRHFARVTALRTATANGDVIRSPVNEAMKGGAPFLGAIADYLKPVRDLDAPTEWRGGWAAVVVDEAILNTPDYAPTREFIRDRFYVKAVVSLGRQAFEYLAHTSAKTSVLLLVRKPERGKPQREPIFFAHAERVGYGPTGNWVGDDLPQVKLEFEEVSLAASAPTTARS